MSNIKTNMTNEKISDVLFFVAFGIFLVSEILLTSFYAQYFTISSLRAIRYTWLIILIIREFFVPKEYNVPTLIRLLFHNIKWLIVFALVIIFTIVLKFATSDNLVFFVLIFALCARNIKFERIAKISFWIILGTVAFIIISSYIGIIESYIHVTETRTRRYMGFLISLYPSMYLFTLTALYLYFRKERITWIELIATMLVNIWIFLQTMSRLAFILSVLIILAFAFLKIKPEFLKRKKVLCGLMIFSFVICLAGSLILVLIYSDSSSVMVQINHTLSNRLFLLHRSISNEGVHLFGHQLNMIGNGLNAWTGEKAQGEYSYVDSFYIQFLLRNGVIFTIICFLLLTVTMYLIYRSENYTLLICMVFIAVGLTIDDELGRLCFNPFLIIIGSFIPHQFMSQREGETNLFPRDGNNLISKLNGLCSWRPIK